MSLTLGLGWLTLGSAQTGPSLLSVGPLFTQISDGVMAEASAPGMRNVITLAYEKMSGRIAPSESHNLGRSGDSFALMTTRMPFATDQVGTAPHIIMLGSFGHNDNVMNLDPAGAPGIAAMGAWEDLVDLFLAGIPAGSNIRIILTTTIGSLVAGESTYAATVNAAQLAYFATKTDSRITVWDAWALYNHTNCTNLSPSSDTSRVHPDDRGARALAFGDVSNDGLYDVLDGLVASATKAEIFTYYSALGTNFDADYTLSGGTGGTKAGTVVPTGSWPTGKRITNNLTNGTDVAVTCSIVDQTGYKQAKAVISGTPAATQTIVMDDTGSITATGSTPGRFYAPILGVKIDDGAGGSPTAAMTWNLAWSNFGNLGSSADGSATLTDGIGRAIDSVIVCQPNPTFSSTIPMAANPAFTVRAFAAAMDFEVTLEHPMLVELYTTARAQPKPLWKAAGEGSNWVQRLTGTFSNGSTIRFEPGRNSGGGLNNTTYTHRKIFMTVTNGSNPDDALVGAGDEMTDMTAATWTWVGAGLVLTRFLWGDLHMDNGIGGEVITRCGPYTIV